VALAFELQDDIDKMLEEARSCDRTILGDMSYEYERDRAFFADSDQRC
jgi:hypothetical protein